MSAWKLWRALPPGDSLRERVALDERSRRAARERTRAELLVEVVGGPVVTGVDTFGAALLADLAAGVAGADDGGHD